MGKDPAFLFYTSDFLTGTVLMNDDQVGKYTRLLCVQHQHGGLIDKISFNAIVKDDVLLRNKFVETDDGFYNSRLMTEMVKRQKKSKNLSKNALKRWNKAGKRRKSKSNAIACELHMPIENENEDKDLKILRANNKKKCFREHVLMTEEEHQKLLDLLGQKETDRWIQVLDDALAIYGYKYKSHYKVILKWREKEDKAQAKERPYADVP
ncbi:MAG: hypothetical protein WCV56_03660 [Candidatus Omnitrophota bacterium]